MEEEGVRDGSMFHVRSPTRSFGLARMTNSVLSIIGLFGYLPYLAAEVLFSDWSILYTTYVKAKYPQQQ